MIINEESKISSANWETFNLCWILQVVWSFCRVSSDFLCSWVFFRILHNFAQPLFYDGECTKNKINFWNIYNITRIFGNFEQIFDCIFILFYANNNCKRDRVIWNTFPITFLWPWFTCSWGFCCQDYSDFLSKVFKQTDGRFCTTTGTTRSKNRTWTPSLTSWYVLESGPKTRSNRNISPFFKVLFMKSRSTKRGPFLIS